MTRHPTRRAVLAATGAGLGAALAGCSRRGENGSGPATGGDCPADESVAPGTADWPSRGGDARNSRAVPRGEAPEPPVVRRWSYALGGYTGSPWPTVVGDAVLTTNLDGTVFAIDADSGEVRWRDRPGDVEAAPAVTADRAAVLGADEVIGYDLAGGDRVWRTDVEGAGPGIAAAVQAAGGAVYVPTYLGVVALDAATGDRRWTYETGFPTGALPAVADGTVYVPSDDTYLHALDAVSGERRWSYKTDGHLSTDPAVVDGTAFLGTTAVGPPHDGRVHAVAVATGERRWTVDFDDGVESLAVGGGYVYAATGDALAALDAATGEECWRSGVYDHSYGGGVVACGDRLYSPVDPPAANDRTVGALDRATGELLWRYEGDLRLYNGPAVADGALFVGGIARDGVAVARLD